MSPHKGANRDMNLHFHDGIVAAVVVVVEKRTSS